MKKQEALALGIANVERDRNESLVQIKHRLRKSKVLS